MTTFAELGLSKPILAALSALGFTQPTEIQQRTIQTIIDGSDVLASAETGSGKTGAYALPLIECLQDPETKPRALVLVPTRELALQVKEQLDAFGSHSGLRSVTVYGGTRYEGQIQALKRGVDIIVATPGRLMDCVQRKYVTLSAIEILVLDEADRLLDMGFMPQVQDIVRKLSKDRQTLMFSATINRQIETIASMFLREPIVVRINTKRVEPSAIEQQMIHVHEFSKDELLLKLINELKTESVLVFTRTRRKASWVADRLREANIDAEQIHGDITQKQREKTLKGFRDGSFPVLVATDVAARGLDIPLISHVVNYDLPDSAEDYVHRIGRTGRAGRAGNAISFVSEEQRFLVRDIEKVIGRQLDPESTPKPKVAMPPRRFRPRRVV